jgi:hypothetical protein
MLYIQRYRPSNTYIIFFSALLIICIYIKFYDKELLKLRSPSANKIIFFSSNDYFHVRLDLTSNTALCQSNDHLIIYILSTVTNFQRRKFIRSTWGSPLNGTCFVFIVGKTKDYNSIELLVNNETEQYKDIIQIDHTETYANVIYKEVGILQWSSHFYPSIPYLFKTDDDLIIDSILISHIAQILVTKVVNSDSYISKYRPELNENLLVADRSKFFRGGWSMDFQETLRFSKFAVSEEVWPHPTLPLYCSGFGWLMSKNVRNRLVNASYIYPLDQIVSVGDVFLSGFLAKAANVKCTGISIDYEQTDSGNCSCLMVQQPMLTVCSSTYHLGSDDDDERKKSKEYKKAWKVIKQRHNLINPTITDIDVC